MSGRFRVSPSIEKVPLGSLKAYPRAHPVNQLTGLFPLFQAGFLGTPLDKTLSLRSLAVQGPLWISSKTDCEKILAISSFRHQS